MEKAGLIYDYFLSLWSEIKYILVDFKLFRTLNQLHYVKNITF